MSNLRPGVELKKRARIFAGIMGAAALLVSATCWITFAPLRLFEMAVEDRVSAAGRRAELPGDLLIVGVDEESITLDQFDPEEIASQPALQLMAESFPWSRVIYAAAIEKILRAGAKIVAVDFLFSNPREGDEELRAVFEKYPGRVVLASNIDVEGSGVARVILPHEGLLSESDVAVGFVNFWPEAGVLRRADYRATLNTLAGKEPRPDEPVFLSFSAAMLQTLGLEGKIPTLGSHRLRPTSQRPETISIYQLFWPDFWERNLRNGEVFRDKIVLIGPMAERFKDIHRTPLGHLPGPELHLQALSAALSGDFIRSTDAAADTGLVFFLSAVAWGVLCVTRRPPLAALFLVFLCLAWVGLVLVVYNALSFLLPVVPPVLAVTVGGVAALAWQFGYEQMEKLRTRRTLERYVSRNLVAEILDHQEDYLQALGGVRRDVTVLFSDVRGFTTMSENTDPAALVSQLNEYLGEMVQAVFAHDGTLDKFIGDAVMAVWGNVRSKGSKEDALHAVRTALDMLRRLRVLNAGWRSRAMPELQIGIGLHHGPAIFGNIGSVEKMEPTVIGDTVNLASRLESLTKQYGLALVLSGEVAELCRDTFPLRRVDRVRVAGKTVPVELFTIPLDESGEPFSPSWLAGYEHALSRMRARDFAGAIEVLEKIHAEEPDDAITALQLERAREFLARPPAEDWDGTISLTKK